VLKAATFMDPRSLQALGRQVAQDLGTHPQIRPLQAAEIAKFWSVICYDLQDPVYILEGNGRKLVLDMEWYQGKWIVFNIDELDAF
jgi:hypothetical protein